jgi:very-short-patch-repair endonuclease
VDNRWNSPVTSIFSAPFRGSVAVASGMLTARRLEGPRFRRLLRDVYVGADAIVDHLTMCKAACLLLPAGGVLSHESAAMLYGVRISFPGPERVHVSIRPEHRLPRSVVMVVHRVRLGSRDVTHRGGLPVTSAGRTAFDLGRRAGLVDAVVALDALLHQRVVRLNQLAEVAERRTGWPGCRRFRAAVALARADVESPMESRVRLMVVLAGLPEPTVQFTVVDTAGRFVARLDLAYEELRIGIEYDGDHHRDRATFRHDAVRLNRLHLLGWSVLRFTADDVLRNPDRMLAQIRAALSRRSANARLST